MSIRALSTTTAAGRLSLLHLAHHMPSSERLPGHPAHARAAHRRRQQHMLPMACAGIQIEQPFAVLPLANFSAIIERDVREQLQASNVSLYCVTFKVNRVPCTAQAC